VALTVCFKLTVFFTVILIKMNDELDEDISGSFVVREAEDVTEGGSDEGVARVGHNKLSRRADTPPPKR